MREKDHERDLAKERSRQCKADLEDPETQLKPWQRKFFAGRLGSALAFCLTKISEMHQNLCMPYQGPAAHDIGIYILHFCHFGHVLYRTKAYEMQRFHRDIPDASHRTSHTA